MSSIYEAGDFSQPESKQDKKLHTLATGILSAIAALGISNAFIAPTMAANDDKPTNTITQIDNGNKVAGEPFFDPAEGEFGTDNSTPATGDLDKTIDRNNERENLKQQIKSLLNELSNTSDLKVTSVTDAELIKDLDCIKFVEGKAYGYNDSGNLLMTIVPLNTNNGKQSFTDLFNNANKSGFLNRPQKFYDNARRYTEQKTYVTGETGSLW